VSRLREAQITAGYLAALPGFFRTPVTSDAARERIAHTQVNRETAFVDLLAQGVYAYEASPYRPLLDRAGVELGDVRRLVRDEGVEGALGRLFDAGIRVSLEEFKGRRPIVRGDLELTVTADDFDNPLATRHFDRMSGGSRGIPRRVSTDFRLLAHEAAYHRLFLDALGLAGRPTAVWSAAPPESAGLRTVLRHVKAGERVDRWLIRTPLPPGLRRFSTERMLRYTVAMSRRFGPGSLAFPEHVPLDEAPAVAHWLAAQVAAGRPAWLDTNASAGVRVCAAASSEGLDLSGTLLRFGGEPYTPAKAEIVAGTGARAVCHYSMAELGRIGFACATPAAPDDVHLLTDKLGFLQRPRALEGGVTVAALHLTTLLASCPKLMLNVEIDDYGTIESRSCGCPLGELGLVTHMYGIRSYEKLTGEGLNLIGSDLIALVDEVLPARFGGAPTDYQLVEEEVDGLTRVGVVISPRVGAVDEQDAVDVVLDALAANPHNTLLAEIWREGQTVRVLRREPYETRAAKILALHVARAETS
jgi:hypothetical protein